MADATPMTDLVKQAVAETRQLVELEVRIAKAEMKEELAHAKRAALLAFALFILVVLTFSALLVALILALGGTPENALLVALALFVCAGAMGGITYALAPKSILPRTRARVEEDVNQLKEHAA